MFKRKRRRRGRGKGGGGGGEIVLRKWKKENSY